MPLRMIQPNHVREWIAELETKGLAPTTISKAYQVLYRAFAVAVAEDGSVKRHAVGLCSPPLRQQSAGTSAPKKSTNSQPPSIEDSRTHRGLTAIQAILRCLEYTETPT